MKSYTVHEPPDAPADRLDRADSLVFVREGFTWSALFFAPLWLLMNQLWLAFAGYAVAAALLGLAYSYLGIDPQWVMIGLVAIHALLAAEGDSLKRWSLARAGWRELAAVTGRNADECQRRFYESWLPSQPVIASRKPGDPTLGDLARRS